MKKCWRQVTESPFKTVVLLYNPQLLYFSKEKLLVKMLNAVRWSKGIYGTQSFFLLSIKISTIFNMELNPVDIFPKQ